MKRREFPARVKVEAFHRAGKRREECTAPLFPGNVHYDHHIPDALGGEPTLENCRVLCRACHGVKTSKADVPAISKAKRREQRNCNAHRSRRPMMGWKKFDGTPVRRQP